MSGRIRTVKPEILEDAVTAGLSDMAFRLFVALILMADDYGRLRAEPRFVAGQVYWAREVPLDQVTAALAELDTLVQFYEVNGQRYAQVRNWAKHQKVSHPGKPRVPPPPETLAPPSGDPPEDLRPLTSDLGSPTTDQGGGPESAPPTPPHSKVAARDASPMSRPGYVSLELAYEPDAERVWAQRTATKEPGKPASDVWANFCGHFAGQDFGGRQALLGRWSKWVDRQCDIAAKDRQAEYDRRDAMNRREASFNARFAKPPGLVEHESRVAPTKAQQEQFAASLERRLAARKAGNA